MIKKLFFIVTCWIISISTYAQRLPKALILTGNGNIPALKENYPPWTHDFHNDKVAQLLQGIVDIDTTTDLKDLNSQHLNKYDLLISNSLFLTPGVNELDAVYQFVASGKSLLTLHCGILSFLNWEKYEELIGGIFIGGPSTEPAKFRVYTNNEEFWGYKYQFRKSAEHPVSRSVNDFDTEDELYYFQPVTPEIDVIARAENHPVMWWHPVKKGKVMSLTLGHDLRAKENTGYQELLKNGVRWLTDYPLIYTSKIPNISNRDLTYKNFINAAMLSDENLKDVAIHSIRNPQSLFKLKEGATGQYDLILNGTEGTASYTLSVRNRNGMITSKEQLLSIVEDGKGNMANYYGNVVSGTRSENENPMFCVGNIVDGDLSTRWSSENCNQAFVLLDMKKEYTVKKLVINWEASYAKSYDLLASIDGKNWSKIHTVNNGRGGQETLDISSSVARFIKLDLKEKPPGKRGYSIYELEVL
ncbi:ThuA domain-containing protein [Chitinophaga sp. S165]|uniref:ThuA domain-containing protein n=1 Tax=Chitinophaga sp. S165 TaxID=2135462 RepID=UPI000D827D23|nr:ThuA domain-containing protein [Chitinophaga sp. S165]PWV57048.1 F5/8 type C domain-containing protein [Chitinophaga sp. S165]